MITAVVCAAFDAATDEAVLAAREVVRATGVRLPARPAHRPHLTLGAARIEPDDLPRVLDVATEVAARHPRFRVSLAEVGVFPPSGVVWLGPAPSAELTLLQHDVDAALQTAGWPRAFGEQSAPEQWVAHCTLATRIPEPRLRTVQAAVRAHHHPVRGRIDALATIVVGGRGDVGYASLG
ncbi:MAG TPA: 2'-5' RNA ligase family protein [Jatrophihabitantaceae bacterium]|jgi:2'-5' RNA ligase